MSERPSHERRSDDRRGGAPRRAGGEAHSGGGRPRRDFEDRRGRGGDSTQGGRRGESAGRNRDDRRGGGTSQSRGGQRGHAQRAGADRNREGGSGPQRPNFREERLNKRLSEPDLPGDIDIKDLDPMVLQDLRVLSRDNAEAVAKHMIMAATLLADEPQLALRHARAAKDRAGRVAVARETCGIAAYHAGEWKEALSELRAARRMSGGPGLLAVMADAERGLGRPEKAIELGFSDDAKELDQESQVELAIVVAGARQDLKQFDSAVVVLQRLQPELNSTGASALRLSYAYGNALVLAGRSDEAAPWFEHVVSLDEDEVTDAKDRLAELN